MTPEAERLQALTNEHSDPQYRVNGVVSNDGRLRQGIRMQGRLADDSQARLPRLVGSPDLQARTRPASQGRAFFLPLHQDWFLSNFLPASDSDVSPGTPTVSYSGCNLL